MANSFHSNGPKALGALTGRILDPAFQKRAGVSSALLVAWADIVGTNFASASRPEKLQWPARKGAESEFQQATLVVACEGSIALHIQHKQDQIITRCNRLLGYSAIGRIKIVQKPVSLSLDRKPIKTKQLTKSQTHAIDQTTSSIADEGLREALANLGRSILSRQ